MGLEAPRVGHGRRRRICGRRARGARRTVGSDVPPDDVITTHHVKLDAADASEKIERLRAALPGYAAELGLDSVALYCTPSGLELLLIGRWPDFTDVTGSLESIHAKPELFSSVDGAEFKVYTLVNEYASEAAHAGRPRGSSRSNR